jgi:ADP-ribosylglycohydrolase
LTGETILSTPTLRDRACGALIGHAIGDSFGDAARTPENHFRYGILTDFPSGKTPGTDDTEFALLAAETILATGGAITDDAVLASWQSYVISLTELHRGGASEREAAANIRRGIRAPLSGMYNAYYMSDGAAMRITPIGIVCAGDPRRAAEMAEIESRISHSRDGIWGAQAIAAAIAVAMCGGSIGEMYQAGIDATPADSWMRYTLVKASEIIDASSSPEDAWAPLHDALVSEYKAVSPEAVAEAFAVFKLAGGNFKRSIILGGNFGRDADTIAAIAGAMSGAYRGIQSIPEQWIAKVRIAAGNCLPFTKDKDIIAVAEALAALIKH